MFEFLDKLNGGEIIALAAVVVGPMIAIVAIVSTAWRRSRIAEMEFTLKHQMIERGMSPDEIEQVLRATIGMPGSSGNPAQDKSAVVQMMIEHGYEGADIERVVKAYASGTAPVDEAELVGRL